MGDIRKLRAAWIADIFDEVSGIITDTEEMYAQAKKHGVFWQPLTCYKKPFPPFHVLKPILSISTNTFYAGTAFHIPIFFHFISYLEKIKANILISNTPGVMGLMAMAAAKILDLPWVDIYHTDMDSYAKKLSKGIIFGNPLVEPVLNVAGLFYLKQYQKQADLIFVRTKEFWDLKIKKGHPAHKLRYYPAGVNIDTFNPRWANRKIWNSYGIKEDRFIVLYVGRITRVKDILFLLEYFRQKNPQDCELVLVGSGPEKDSYEKEYGQQKNIHFLGIKRGQELQKIYASADLYVLPSPTETLGKTVLEALASGIPVVVSDKGGPKDYVRDKFNGRLFSAGNYHHFCEVMDETLRQRELLKTMGQNARPSVLEHTDEKLFLNFAQNIAALVK
ncbi:MAG: glycosyltransferase [Leptospiraceae bacterium]|nr:glycosyltransferase [Leptospiraceae bacterium]MDW8307474.1 glycosyltransferase [Leptospiraceae bacterium]